jgi:hypothetical protein
VDGLVTSDKKVRKLILDREAWRSRQDQDDHSSCKSRSTADSSKREDSKIRRIKTRSAIVVV